MTSITNKSKENATINKTVKDGTVTIEVVGSKNKTVRPIMTVEARDALDALLGSEFPDDIFTMTRSEKIIELERVINKAKARYKYYELRAHNLGCSLDVQAVRGASDIRAANKVALKWMLCALSMTAACVALAATMMITAS